MYLCISIFQRHSCFRPRSNKLKIMKELYDYMCVCVCILYTHHSSNNLYLSVARFAEISSQLGVCTRLNCALQTHTDSRSHPAGSHCFPQKSDAGPEARTLADAEIFPRKAESSRRSSVENRERGNDNASPSMRIHGRACLCCEKLRPARRIRVYSSYNLHLSDRRFIPSCRRALVNFSHLSRPLSP